MHKQNLRQRLAIRGSNMTESVQDNDNNQTLPFLWDGLDNFAPVETKQ